MKIVDVDKTWDGKGSLDEHRQKMFKEIEHPGFGKLPAQKPSTIIESSADGGVTWVANEADDLDPVTEEAAD